ncbi:MAG: alpha/beta fold hydrolase [Caldithrix sp.]|nr:alpha/beta fold hydrolase [Caldithrix sp.]
MGTLLTSIIFLSLIGVLGLFAFFNYIIHKIFFLSHVSNQELPKDFDLDVREYFIKTRHDKKIQLWDLNNKSKGPILLGIHGWANSSSVLLPLASALNKHWRTILINARNHGDSEDDSIVTLIKYKEDIESVMHWLEKNEKIENRPIILFGHSLGGASAMFTAVRNNKIHSVISISAFADLELILRKGMEKQKMFRPFIKSFLTYIEFRTGEHLNDVTPISTIARYQGPVLIAHGVKDEVIDVKDAELLVQKADRDNVSLIKMANHNHSSLLKDSALAEHIIQFIKNYLTAEQL